MSQFASFLRFCRCVKTCETTFECQKTRRNTATASIYGALESPSRARRVEDCQNTQAFSSSIQKSRWAQSPKGHPKIIQSTELKAAQLKKPAPKATLKANGLKANKHELKKPAPKAMPKLKSMNHFLGDGSGPSTPQGLSTTDGWSVAEIVVATFGGFVALVVGAVLFQRCSKKDNPTTETNADTAKNRDDVNNESEELLPENIIF